MDRNIIEHFKKVFGISKIGMGYFADLYKDFGLPSQGWEEISSGVIEGNFDHLYYGGKNYYQFIIDPYDNTDQLVIFETYRLKNYEELVEMVHYFFHIINMEETKQKTCWECGRKYGFFDIIKNEDLSYRKNFERAMSCWESNHCGCH